MSECLRNWSEKTRESWLKRKRQTFDVRHADDIVCKPAIFITISTDELNGREPGTRIQCWVCAVQSGC